MLGFGNISFGRLINLGFLFVGLISFARDGMGLYAHSRLTEA